LENLSTIVKSQRRGEHEYKGTSSDFLRDATTIRTVKNMVSGRRESFNIFYQL